MNVINEDKKKENIPYGFPETIYHVETLLNTHVGHIYIYRVNKRRFLAEVLAGFGIFFLQNVMAANIREMARGFL